MSPRFAPLLVLCALLAAAVAPASAATTSPVGTAQTTASLASVTLQGLPLPIQGVNLGHLRSFASTDTDAARNPAAKPFASASVALPVVGEVAARSDGDTGHAPQTLALPAGAGTLQVGGLTASVSDGVARALVSGLAADISATVAGLRAEVPTSGAFSIVDTQTASATNAAHLRGLSLGLSDLIPVDILEQLPLGTLLDLLDGLALQLPVNLTGVVNEVRALVDQLGAVETLQATIGQVQTQLTTLGSQLSDANAALAAANAAVTTLTAERDALQAQLDTLTASLLGATCPSAIPAIQLICDQITAVQQDLAAKQAELDGAIAQVATIESTIAALNAQISQLESTLTSLVDQLNQVLDELLALLDGLTLQDLLDAIRAIVDGLAGLELLGIDRVTVGVEATATAGSSAASALCRVEGVRVLGGAAPASLDTCAELQAVLGQVQNTVLGLLRELPVVGQVAGGAVQIRGLQTSTTPANHREGDYFVGTSAVGPLSLDVSPLQLTQATDTLFGTVQGLVDDLVAQLGGLTGVTIDTTALEDALDELQSQLAGLPAGDLAGVSTPRLAVSGLGLNAASSFRAAGTAVPGLPTTPPAQTTPPPAQTTPPPAQTPLPVTGGGLGVGLVLLAAGAGLGLLFRRRTA